MFYFLSSNPVSHRVLAQCFLLQVKTVSTFQHTCMRYFQSCNHQHQKSKILSAISVFSFSQVLGSQIPWQTIIFASVPETMETHLQVFFGAMKIHGNLLYITLISIKTGFSTVVKKHIEMEHVHFYNH